MAARRRPTGLYKSYQLLDQGDVSEFAKLYPTLLDWLREHLCIAFQSFQDEAEIESVAHSVLLKTMALHLNREKSRCRGTTDREVANWILTIATNTMRNKIKHEKRWQSIDTIEHQLAASNPGMTRDLNVELLGRCLEELTAREREVFDLKIAGYPEAEIARQLGISPARVSQIMAEIRRKLRPHFYDRDE